MRGILSIDTESDKPFKFFSAFGGTALIPQCQALGLVAECVNIYYEYRDRFRVGY